MKKFVKLILTAGVLMGLSHMAQAADPIEKPMGEMASENTDSVLVAMFKWLNETYDSDQDFTEAGFAQFFTDDILFIVNGQKRERGISALTQRYNDLKGRYAHIEILFPFKEEERVGEKIFTYYVNEGWQDDVNPVVITTHVMGYVELEGEKMSLLNFVFADIEPEK